MIFDYTFEKYHNWKENEGIMFKRKLENETAFDGIIKIYSLKTNSPQLNNFLKNKFFGEFFYASKTGVFLRMFDHKESWPNTTLTFIDLTRLTITDVKRTDSSWNVWSATDLGDDKHSIAISPTENIEYQVK